MPVFNLVSQIGWVIYIDANKDKDGNTVPWRTKKGWPICRAKFSVRHPYDRPDGTSYSQESKVMLRIEGDYAEWFCEHLKPGDKIAIKGRLFLEMSNHKDYANKLVVAVDRWESLRDNRYEGPGGVPKGSKEEN